jgi:hexulose-6-phosphate isomerase
MNRRDFVKLGSGALAAATLGPVALAAVDKPKKTPLHKAIMYATIGYPGSVMEKFKAVKAAGFEGVEPMSHMNQDDVVKALETTGLKAASVCCNTHWGSPLSDPDEKVRKAGLEGLSQTLKDAKRYGASSVLLVPGKVTDKVSYDDCWKRSIAEIKKIIPLAADLGVKIAIENVWNGFIYTPEQAKNYLEEIGSPQVGWHFDIGNVYPRGVDPKKWVPAETWVAVLGKRILKLHIKEFSKRVGFGVRFFEGDNNWPAIMKTLAKVGYDGWGITEQPGNQAKDAATLAELSKRYDRILAS